MKEIEMELPSIIINIGGVSNLTYFDGENIIGFDVGPGNGLMDTYVQSYFNLPFDNQGNLARSGKINHEFLKKV